MQPRQSARQLAGQSVTLAEQKLDNLYPEEEKNVYASSPPAPETDIDTGTDTDSEVDEPSSCDYPLRGSLDDTNSDSKNDFSPRAKDDVVVIGGGIAGCSAALELAARGFKVMLLEKSTLFSGSSGKTPGRLGLGFHYGHVDTAVMYLKETLDFVKKNPGFRVGEDLELNHPVRRGHYYILKNSMPGPQEVLSVYTKLKKVYEEEVKNDPTLIKTWGTVDNFFRVLKKEQYEKGVDASQVAIGIETAEHLLDWQKFSESLKEKVLFSSDIIVRENIEVVDIKRGSYGSIYNKRFVIFDSNKEVLTADYVVNATWGDIKRLNAMANVADPTPIVNRTKVIATVKLPDKLKGMHSVFMCMGAGCMFTNLGNGYGKMTYAPVTNVFATKPDQLQPDEKQQALIAVTAEEKARVGQAILNGVNSFVKMPGVMVERIDYGVVQTKGEEANIYDIKSALHKRNYYLIRVNELGWVSAPAMKLPYGVEMAPIVGDVMKSHRDQTEKMKNRYIISSSATRSAAQFLKQFINFKVEECALSDLEKHTKLFEEITLPTINRKAILNRSINDLSKKFGSPSTMQAASPTSFGLYKKPKVKEEKPLPINQQHIATSQDYSSKFRQSLFHRKKEGNRNHSQCSVSDGSRRPGLTTSIIPCFKL